MQGQPIASQNYGKPYNTALILQTSFSYHGMMLPSTTGVPSGVALHTVLHCTYCCSAPEANADTDSELTKYVTYTTVHVTPPWGGFPSSISRQPRGRQYRKIRLRKTLGKMLPTATSLARTLLQLLWNYRARKIGLMYTFVPGMR